MLGRDHVAQQAVALHAQAQRARFIALHLGAEGAGELGVFRDVLQAHEIAVPGGAAGVDGSAHGVGVGIGYIFGNLIASVNAVFQAELAESGKGFLGLEHYALALAVVAAFAALLIATILAHATAIAEARGFAPLLLLDEPAVHLDAARRVALFEALVAIGAQTVMTGTDADVFASLRGVAEFLVAGDGKLRPEVP